jgi:hypothetical protein
VCVCVLPSTGEFAYAFLPFCSLPLRPASGTHGQRLCAIKISRRFFFASLARSSDCFEMYQSDALTTVFCRLPARPPSSSSLVSPIPSSTLKPRRPPLDPRSDYPIRPSTPHHILIAAACPKWSGLICSDLLCLDLPCRLPPVSSLSHRLHFSSAPLSPCSYRDGPSRLLAHDQTSTDTSRFDSFRLDRSIH